ncbi:hypothetical protein [Clostridium cadaveris]|uniref:hypothetical protein n=1 Tax=Clostridium cadaveris TaxID=1529 RepID=UPI0039917F67
MVTKTNVMDAINKIRSELSWVNKELACGTERSEIGIQVSEVFNAIEEAENTASEYIDNVISLKDDLEQTIDKLREVNY